MNNKERQDNLEQQAREWMRNMDYADIPTDKTGASTNALLAAFARHILSQQAVPNRDPVAWMQEDGRHVVAKPNYEDMVPLGRALYPIPLYDHLPPAVPNSGKVLTDEEIDRLCKEWEAEMKDRDCDHIDAAIIGLYKGLRDARDNGYLAPASPDHPHVPNREAIQKFAHDFCGKWAQTFSSHDRVAIIIELREALEMFLFGENERSKAIDKSDQAGDGGVRELLEAGGAMENALRYAKCPGCDGSGGISRVVDHAVPECCGNASPSGDCCGNPVPRIEREEVYEPCEWCHRSKESIRAWDRAKAKPIDSIKVGEGDNTDTKP
jgi:hypothetical protein